LEESFYRVSHEGYRPKWKATPNMKSAVVSFFGLFYYWVVLSKNYRALAAFDDLLIEDPQKRESDRPLLRGQTGKVRLSWPQVMEACCNNPADTVTAASRYATRKFKEAINTGT